MSFSALSLNSSLLAALPPTVNKPSRIQQLAIPTILLGQDVLALAQTGSGKTYAYGLPVLQHISQLSTSHLSAVIIVPTIYA